MAMSLRCELIVDGFEDPFFITVNIEGFEDPFFALKKLEVFSKSLTGKLEIKSRDTKTLRFRTDP